MFLIDAIDPKIFFISFGVAMFFSYIFAKTPRIIYKYPTPYNVDATVYTDNAGLCYKYDVQEVQCPSDISQIQPVYFQ
jgi:hypothetical protein